MLHAILSSWRLLSAQKIETQNWNLLTLAWWVVGGSYLKQTCHCCCCCSSPTTWTRCPRLSPHCWPPGTWCTFQFLLFFILPITISLLDLIIIVKCYPSLSSSSSSAPSSVSMLLSSMMSSRSRYLPTQFRINILPISSSSCNYTYLSWTDFCELKRNDWQGHRTTFSDRVFKIRLNTEEPWQHWKDYATK